MFDRPQLASSEIPFTDPRHLRLYGHFWDIVSVLIFSAGALNVLYTGRGELTWRHWTAFGLTAAQGVLYIFAIALRGWPIARRWLALYFIGGLGLWVSAGLIYPSTWWVGMTYFGQMLGLLPLRAVVPGSFLVNVLVILYISNWDLARITPGLLMGFGFQWIGAIAVYLFIASIIRTSQERGGLIAKLEMARRELEAARQKDVELAALRERERLARDLHDSLGHVLVALSVQLEAIQRLYKVDPERASAQVDELKALTRRSMDGLRRSLAGLRAPGLGEKPLSQALHLLSVETGQRAGLKVECRVAEGVDQLSPVVAETLWRVAQESLTNVEKHAHARQVEIDLQLQPQTALLRVCDDGVGITPAAEDQPGHYGLRGMRERVEGLGGALKISGHGPGAVVEARLPTLADTAQLVTPALGD